MIRVKRLGLLCIAALIFISCNNTAKDTPEVFPGINIPIKRFNSAIKLLDAPESLNSHKNGDVLLLRIINLSSATIVFPENYGIKLFAKRDGEWVEFPNNSYNAGDVFYLPTTDSYPLGLIASIMPYMDSLTSPTTVRVVIVGHIENDSEEVGAYVDVIITP